MALELKSQSACGDVLQVTKDNQAQVYLPTSEPAFVDFLHKGELRL
jgi:hypothetical protein